MAMFNLDGTVKDVDLMEAKLDDTEQYSSENTDNSIVKRYKLKASSTQKEMRYWQCQHQSTSKGDLAKHIRAVHEGIKYHCGQCQYQATSTESLAQHTKAVHQGIKYPCGQCQHQSTSKGNLAQHKRTVHK